MGWNDRLDNPDAYEEYVEAVLDQADRDRDALESQDRRAEAGPEERE